MSSNFDIEIFRNGRTMNKEQMTQAILWLIDKVMFNEDMAKSFSVESKNEKPRFKTKTFWLKNLVGFGLGDIPDKKQKTYIQELSLIAGHFRQPFFSIPKEIKITAPIKNKKDKITYKVYDENANIIVNRSFDLPNDYIIFDDEWKTILSLVANDCLSKIESWGNQDSNASKGHLKTKE